MNKHKPKIVLNVLAACESSATVRDDCDLLPCDANPRYHVDNTRYNKAYLTLLALLPHPTPIELDELAERVAEQFRQLKKGTN